MHLRTDTPGDMMRGLSYHFSSYTALLACQLAELGATGPRLALDGEAGFLRQAGGSDQMLIAALRDRGGFRLTRAAFKAAVSPALPVADRCEMVRLFRR